MRAPWYIIGRTGKAPCRGQRLSSKHGSQKEAMSNLAALFESLSDEELTRRIVSGILSEEALPIAQSEAQNRGLGELFPMESAPTEAAYEGDMVELERSLSPQEAQVFASMLQSAGINASAGDTNLVQANTFLTLAVGGCRVRVPEGRLQEAKDLLSAFRRGDFALGDDFDPESSGNSDA